MGEAPLILGVSGLRGIVGESLTPEVARRYAGVVGEWFRGFEGEAKVGVGADGRAGYEPIYEAVLAGLSAAGCAVTPLGVQMTPTVGWFVDREGLTGGVVVTASHNPAQWNGIKVLLRSGADGRTAAPTAAQAASIVERFRGAQPSLGEATRGGCVEPEGTATAHAAWVADRAMRIGNPSGRSVALDSVNASGSAGAEALCRSMGARPIQLFGDRGGVFPHTPEPTRENLSGEGGLCDAVPGNNADVGFAQDPDADRLAIVDEMGEYIGEEYTLVLAALSLLEARKESGEDGAPHPGPLPGGENDEEAKKQAVIVTNLSTSRMIDDVAARYGARVERTAVGEANVVERMKALTASGEDVVLGGEGNGGVIWPEVVYVRDSLGAMALTLALMARKGMKVSELVSWIDSMAGQRGDGYVILKRKVDIPSKEAAAPAVEAVRRGCEGENGAEIDLQDGVRVDWPGERAWVHVRASNTEPIMRLICEAPSAGAAEALLARIEGMIGGG
ncbi:MAG: phosphoglucosamine mutase [Phycisphaerales bacterium JB059]